MKFKDILLAAVILPVLPLSARDFALSLWRGETTTRRIPDYVTVGDAPAGLKVKVGPALPVRYLKFPASVHYDFAADRVAWGSSEVGPKYVSVTAAAEAKPGVYRCGDLAITVIDRVLPPAGERKYFLDLWQHPWSVARYFAVAPFSSGHYAKMRPLWETLAEAGQKSLTVTITDRPWNHQCYDAYGTMVRHVRRDDGTWFFDYRVFDEYVAFGRSCGIGPYIACYTMCPWDYEVFWETESGAVKSARAVPGTPEFTEYWGAFLPDFAAHLREKGWFDETFIAMDERSPEDVMNICRFIEQKAPGLKTSLAGNRAPSEFKGIHLDIYCSGLGHLTDRLLAEARERREKGMVTTFYVCCGPTYPNTFSTSQPFEAFWLGAYPAFCGLDGFLRWAWNSWPQDPVVDSSYSGLGWDWKAGDTYLIYPNGEPSVRFLNLYNGIMAAEKVRILREQGLFADELKALAARYDRKAAMANKSDFGRIFIDTINLVNRP